MMPGVWACEEHFSQVVKDLRQKGYSISWTCSEADQEFTCEYPGCNKQSFFDVLGFKKKSGSEGVKLIEG